MKQGEFSKKMFLDIESKGPQIIEYFVKYYGEQYRPIIEQKLSSVIFCFYEGELVEDNIRYYKKAALRASPKNAFGLLTKRGDVGRNYKELIDNKDEFVGKRRLEKDEDSKTALHKDAESIIQENVDMLDQEAADNVIKAVYDQVGVGGRAVSFINKQGGFNPVVFLRVDQEKGVYDETIVHELIHVLDYELVSLEEFEAKDSLSTHQQEIYGYLKERGVEKIGGTSFFPADYVVKDKVLMSVDFLKEEMKEELNARKAKLIDEWNQNNPDKVIDWQTRKQLSSQAEKEILQENPEFARMLEVEKCLSRRSAFSEVLTQYRANKIYDLMKADNFKICGGRQVCPSGYQVGVDAYRPVLDLVEEQIKVLSTGCGSEVLEPMVEVLDGEYADLLMRGISCGTYDENAEQLDESAQFRKDYGAITQEEYNRLIAFSSEKLKERGKEPQEVDDVKMNF